MDIVIVGSGMAGITFAEELVKLSPACKVTVVTHETHGYYSRPMLSHGFSRDDVETKIILRRFPELETGGIHIQADTDVTHIDRSAKQIVCRHRGQDQDSFIGYDTLVLAPGSDAFIPPPLRASAGLCRVINSLDDLIGLRHQRAGLIAAGQQPRWAIVGGGLIGCEVASDLATAGDQVVLFHALPRLMERQLVDQDSAILLKVLQELGVDVRLDSAVDRFSEVDGQLAVNLATGQEAGFDGIIVATGFKPRTALAQAAGLDVNRGIVVDAFLTTSDPDILALGDAVECADGRIYAYVMPIRQQALWLARYVAGQTRDPWQVPVFKPRAKVHGFTATQPYLF